MTYNVFGGTLNLTQSINQSTRQALRVTKYQLNLITSSVHRNTRTKLHQVSLSRFLSNDTIVAQCLRDSGASRPCVGLGIGQVCWFVLLLSSTLTFYCYM